MSARVQEFEAVFCLQPKRIPIGVLFHHPRNHRVFFRDHGDYLHIERVFDRQQAYC